MRTVAIDKPEGELKSLLDASRRGRVLVKRNGKPLAVLIDVRDKDEEQIQLENDPEFWRMIQERRREPTVPWEELKAELGLPPQGAKRAPPKATGAYRSKGRKIKAKSKGTRNGTA